MVGLIEEKDEFAESDISELQDYLKGRCDTNEQNKAVYSR